MNKEIIKAMNKKETKANNLRKWWDRNGYKVMRVVLFPLWIGIKIKDKINKYLNSKNAWNEERAKKILNYYIPREANWNAEKKCFYFFDNGYGWTSKSAKKHIKIRDRRFWRLHNGCVGSTIRNYLIDKFELEGFKKEIGDCYDYLTEITFRMIEE